MIGRTHRFHGHNSLRHVYQHGRTVRGPMFAVRSVSNDRRSQFRAAVVVSKKVSKLAVVRNRIRRRLYEELRHQQPNIVRPYDIALTVFSDAVADMPIVDLRTQLHTLLTQSGVIPRARDMIEIPEPNKEH